MRFSGKGLLVAAATATAIVVIAPHLRSASLRTPTFTQTNLVSDIPGMAARTSGAAARTLISARPLNTVTNGIARSTRKGGSPITSDSSAT